MNIIQLQKKSSSVFFSKRYSLLVGTSDLGATKLVETLFIILSLSAKHIQFTPDLMPTDIIRSEVLNEDEQENVIFSLPLNPSFINLLWQMKLTAPILTPNQPFCKLCRNIIFLFQVKIIP